MFKAIFKLAAILFALGVVAYFVPSLKLGGMNMKEHVHVFVEEHEALKNLRDKFVTGMKGNAITKGMVEEEEKGGKQGKEKYIEEIDIEDEKKMKEILHKNDN